jgi:hypothetical protein
MLRSAWAGIYFKLSEDACCGEPTAFAQSAVA